MDKKSFFWKMSLFLLLFLTVSEIVNIVYISSVLVYSKDYRTERQFMHKKDSIHTLVVGDSHPRVAVYPKLMDGVFVMTSGDENYIYTYYRLLHIITKGTSDIQLVVIPIDLHSFSSYRIHRLVNVDYWRKYINYWQLGLYKRDLLSHLLKRLEGEFAYINGVDDISHVIRIKTGVKKLDIITDGHITLTAHFSHEKDTKASAHNLVRRHFKNHEVLDKDNVFFFTKIIDLLLLHDIDIVLVKYPITKEYYFLAGKYMDIDLYNTSIIKILDDNGYDLPILDYHNLFWNNKRFFSDAEHLNITGAKKFTLIFREDLTNLGLYPIK